MIFLLPLFWPKCLVVLLLMVLITIMFSNAIRIPVGELLKDFLLKLKQVKNWKLEEAQFKDFWQFSSSTEFHSLFLIEEHYLVLANLTFSCYNILLSLVTWPWSQVISWSAGFRSGDKCEFALGELIPLSLKNRQGTAGEEKAIQRAFCRVQFGIWIPSVHPFQRGPTMNPYVLR